MKDKIRKKSTLGKDTKVYGHFVINVYYISYTFSIWGFNFSPDKLRFKSHFVGFGSTTKWEIMGESTLEKKNEEISKIDFSFFPIFP